MNRKVALFAAPLLGATASLLTTMSASHAQGGGGTVIVTDMPLTPGTGARQEVFNSDGPCEAAQAEVPNLYDKTVITNVSNHPITGNVKWDDMTTGQSFFVPQYANVTLVDPGPLDIGGQVSFTSCPAATPIPTGPTDTAGPTGTATPTDTAAPTGSPTASTIVTPTSTGPVPSITS